MDARIQELQGPALGDRAEIVIGIGASAGGIEALERFLSQVAPDSGLSFVVAQHLDRHHASRLAALLARHGPLPAREAQDGDRPAPGEVRVIPPGSILTLRDGVLRVTAAPATGQRTPIDALFRSLAEELGERAAGVLLSGAGTDGTLGLRAIKERGGLTLAQDPRTAAHGGMPESAIAAGVVDEVLPPEQMPARLLAHALTLARGAPEAEAAENDDVRAALPRICQLLKEKTGHDFARYKQATLLRRIRRRIHVLQLGGAEEYARALGEDGKEPALLLRDLLIGVTQFFRDPAAFELLAEQVIPRLVQDASPDNRVRVWVPGCATGEEAYSLAMLLREGLPEGMRGATRIFATDIDGQALAVARAGQYPEAVAEHVPPERLERFFTRDPHGYHVVKELRDMCVFSSHSLVRDPPFSSLDLVSCRNVLIYLDADLQRRVVPLFHYALRKGGYLFLGPFEDAGTLGEAFAPVDRLFVPVDRDHRVFQRRDAANRAALDFPYSSSRTLPVLPRPAAAVPAAPSPKQAAHQAFERMILEEYAPAAALVDERGEILRVAGKFGQILQPRPGAFSPTLLGHAEGALRQALKAALAEASEKGGVVRSEVTARVDGSSRALRLTVRPGPGSSAHLGLRAVIVEDLGPKASARAAGTHAPLIEQLESELMTARADLQSTVQELEASNEELETSNEELETSNEELTSTNEELSTSMEELQSVNEELEMMIAELRQKVQDLREADRQKNEFLAMLSHELRNPLAPIRNSLRILDKVPPGSPQAQRSKAVLDRQVAQLARLVDDLLDTARLTRNQIRLQREPTALRELVERTVEDHRSLFEGAGLALELDLGDSPLLVDADRARLAQLVGNLLHNAVKFTAKGGAVKVRLSAEPASRSAVLRVSDTGVGMDEATMARLFQPFVQADSTLDRSKGGLGLGLALVKVLAELHGGGVAASSDGLGKGSEITVRLPLYEAPAPEDAGLSVAPPSGARRVLVVEDNVDAAETLKDAIELFGHRVEIAHDGPAGVVKARDFHPEIVLCDVGLPGMDGFEVARALRADGAHDGTLLVALTGYARPEDIEKSRQAGFDEHMAKPPDLDRLERLLANLPAHPRAQARAAGPEAER
jgi:chemotaxis methyl-accepting protein methylase/signal transduction histidine kinase/chemotaxis response regulator CheB